MRINYKTTLFLSLIILLYFFLTSGFAAEKAATVVAVRGGVKVISKDGETKELKSKDSINQSDTINTGKRGRIQILFSDGTLISLGRKTEMKISEYQWNRDNKKGALKTTVKEGTFRVMGGAITKYAPKNFTTDTPTATIGIRGSSYTGAVLPIPSPNPVPTFSLSVYFQGGKGIDITNDAGTVGITTPGFGTRVLSPELPPLEPFTFTPQDIAAIDHALVGTVDEGDDDGTDQDKQEKGKGEEKKENNDKDKKDGDKEDKKNPKDADKDKEGDKKDNQAKKEDGQKDQDNKDGDPDQKDGKPDKKGDPDQKDGDPNQQRDGDPNQRDDDPNQRDGDPNQRDGDPNQRDGDPNQRDGDPNQRNGDPNQRNSDPNQRDGGPNQRGGDPNQQGQGPNQQGGEPNFQGHDSNQQGGDPNFQGGDPNFQGGDPNFQGGDPNFQGGGPNFQGGDPNFQGGDPNFQGGDPNFQGGDPNFQGGDPNFQGGDQNFQGSNFNPAFGGTYDPNLVGGNYDPAFGDTYDPYFDPIYDPNQITTDQQQTNTNDNTTTHTHIIQAFDSGKFWEAWDSNGNSVPGTSDRWLHGNFTSVTSDDGLISGTVSGSLIDNTGTSTSSANFSYLMTLQAYNPSAVYSGITSAQTNLNIVQPNGTSVPSTRYYRWDNKGEFAYFATSGSTDNTNLYTELTFAGIESLAANMKTTGVSHYNGHLLHILQDTLNSSTRNREIGLEKLYLAANWNNGKIFGVVLDQQTGSVYSEPPDAFIFGKINGTTIEQFIATGPIHAYSELNKATPDPNAFERFYSYTPASIGSFYGSEGQAFGVQLSGYDFKLLNGSTTNNWKVLATGLQKSYVTPSPQGTSSWNGYVAGLAIDFNNNSTMRLYMNKNPNQFNFTINQSTGEMSGSLSAEDYWTPGTTDSLNFIQSMQITSGNSYYISDDSLAAFFPVAVQ